MSIKEQGKIKEANFWDKVANERIYSAFSEKEYTCLFDRHLNGTGRGRALDVGCASGVASVMLARRGFQVKGIDISPKLIDQARRLWKGEANLPEFSVGDAENLDAQTGEFDLCFLGGVIHHFPESIKVLKELMRVLKKGGILLMVEPNCLDVVEMVSWFFAGKLNLLSPNEYPVSPLEIKHKLSDDFGDFDIYPIRDDDIPFFSFIPVLGNRFFRGGKGKRIKKIPLVLLNLCRPRLLDRGNFFVLACVKK